MVIHRFHFNTIDEIKRLVFSSDLITENHKARKIFITSLFKEGFGLSDENKFYWVLDHEGSRSLLHKDFINMLPLIPIKTVEVADGKEVYNLIEEFRRVNINPKQMMGFRYLVDNFCDYSHSEPQDFLLYKIILLAGWIDRIYVRIASSKEFGKDSIPTNAETMFSYINKVSNPTRAKLEYEIIGSRLLIINELAELEKKEKMAMQQFFLDTAADQPRYTKRSRAKKKSGEKIDILRLSEVILYNNLKYYKDKDQQCFDDMFTKAVLTRFLPLLLKGRLDLEQFRDRRSLKTIAKANTALYTRMLKTVHWLADSHEDYSHNYLTLLHNYKSTVTLNGRQGSVFATIFKFIDMYSDTQEECTILEQLLYQRYNEYMDQFKVIKEGQLKVEDEYVNG